jgi:hypothetical protein
MAKISFFLLFVFQFFWLYAGSSGSTIIDLSGTWKFAVDPQDLGISRKWYSNGLDDHIQLPGTMAMNGKGNDITLETRFTGSIDGNFYTQDKYKDYRQPGNIMLPWFLTPVKEYVGAAWYQKEIDIPPSWQGKDVELFLERCHWESRLWINDTPLGIQNSLVAPHVYIIKGLKAGKHRLTIRIDNTVKIAVGENAHSITDHTQTNWNGIMGEISLRVIEPVRISQTRIFADVAQRKILIETTIENGKQRRQKAVIHFKVERSHPIKELLFPKFSEKVRLNPGTNTSLLNILWVKKLNYGVNSLLWFIILLLPYYIKRA